MISSRKENVIDLYQKKISQVKTYNSKIEFIGKVQRKPEDLSALIRIDLRKNLLNEESIMVTDFVDGIEIDELSLNFNKFRCINNNSLQFFKYFGTINLSGNSIRYLKSNYFMDMNFLKVLNISGNGVRKIEKNAFSNLKNLEKLDLSNNLISVLDDYIFNFNSVNHHLCLYLSSNKIKNYNQKSFVNPENLILLSLENNSIEKISKNCFNLHTFIKHINLNSNSITHLEKHAFRNLVCLERICLGSNDISIINKESFLKLPLIKCIELEKNKIKRIDSKSFSELNTKSNKEIENDCLIISFNENHIETISKGAFNNCFNMVSSNFSHNKLVQIDEFLTGSQFETITSLNLSYCRIKRLEKALIRSMPKIKEIDFSHNEIECIQTNTFYNLKNLETINLSYNKISTLEEYSFSKLDNIDIIDLKSNQLEKMNQFTFSKLNFKIKEVGLYVKNTGDKIDLSHNKIYYIDKNGVFECENLEYFIVGFNNLFKIPNELLKNQLQLKYLDLSNNDIIDIKTHCFKDMKNIIKINLSNNRIKELKEESFCDLPSLAEIDLSNNEIEQIHHAFKDIGTNSKSLNIQLKCNKTRNEYFDKIMLENKKILLSYIVSLDLSNNMIDLLPINQFKLLINLKTLNISNNKIKIIQSDSFDGLLNLNELIIESNQIIKLEKESFKNLYSLRTLSLKENNIAEIEKGAFSELKNLRVFSISNNELINIDNNWFINCNSSYVDFDISNNKIKNIGNEDLRSFRYCRILNLSFNQLTEITKDTFSNLEIREIYLNNCSIQKIQKGAFFNYSLNLLDLSCNQLERFNGEIFFSCYEEMNYEGCVTHLYLKNNKIKDINEFFQQCGQYFKSIKSIDLSFNDLIYVNLEFISNIHNITLDDNKIVVVDLSHPPKKKINISLKNNFITDKKLILLRGFDTDFNLINKTVKERNSLFSIQELENSEKSLQIAQHDLTFSSLFDKLINNGIKKNFGKYFFNCLNNIELYKLIQKFDANNRYEDEDLFLLLLVVNLDRDTIPLLICNSLMDHNSKLLKMLLQCSFLLNDVIYSNKIYYHIKCLKDLQYWGSIYKAIFGNTIEQENFRKENKFIINKITSDYKNFKYGVSYKELKVSLLNNESINFIGKNCTDEVFRILYEFNFFTIDKYINCLLEKFINYGNWQFLKRLIKFADKEESNRHIKEKLYDLTKCFFLEMSELLKFYREKKLSYFTEEISSYFDELLKKNELIPESELDKVLEKPDNILEYLIVTQILKQNAQVGNCLKNDKILAELFQNTLDDLNDKFCEFFKMFNQNHECILDKIDERILIESLKDIKCFECFYDIKNIKQKYIDKNIDLIIKCITEKYEQSLKFLIRKSKKEANNGNLVFHENFCINDLVDNLFLTHYNDGNFVLSIISEICLCENGNCYLSNYELDSILQKDEHINLIRLFDSDKFTCKKFSNKLNLEELENKLCIAAKNKCFKIFKYLFSILITEKDLENYEVYIDNLIINSSEFGDFELVYEIIKSIHDSHLLKKNTSNNSIEILINFKSFMHLVENQNVLYLKKIFGKLKINLAVEKCLIDNFLNDIIDQVNEEHYVLTLEFLRKSYNMINDKLPHNYNFDIKLLNRLIDKKWRNGIDSCLNFCIIEDEKNKKEYSFLALEITESNQPHKITKHDNLKKQKLERLTSLASMKENPIRLIKKNQILPEKTDENVSLEMEGNILEKVNNSYNFTVFEERSDSSMNIHDSKLDEQEKDQTNAQKDQLDKKTINVHTVLKNLSQFNSDILMHDTIQTFCDSKWKLFPRFLYYMHLFLHLTIAIGFTVNSVYYDEAYPLPAIISYIVIMSILSICLLFFEVIQYIRERKSYFVSPRNILELLSYLLVLAHIIFKSITLVNVQSSNLSNPTTNSVNFTSVDEYTRSAESSIISITILFLYITFIFNLEKVSRIGVFVGAIKESLKKSLPLIPLFILFFIGFFFSFRSRKNFGYLSFFNSGNSYSVGRVFNLIFGEISTQDFEFNEINLINDVINLIIYLFFTYLVTVIFLNLFLGIAIGELTEVLKETKVIQTKLRLEYIISIEEIEFFTPKMRLHDALTPKEND